MKARASLLLTPADVAMFRDTRPFGQTSSGSRSEFPTPRTVVGAVRTWLLHAAGVHVRDLPRGVPTTKQALRALCHAKGDGEWVVEAEFKGPFLIRDGTTFLAAPVHLVDLGEDTGKLMPLSTPPPGWRPPPGAPDPKAFRPLWLKNRQEWKPLEGGFIAAASLAERVLPAGTTLRRHEWEEVSRFWQLEPRLGIGLDPERHAADDGFLYTSSFLRLESRVGMRVDVAADAPDLEARLRAAIQKQPWVRLGGEGRAASVKLIEVPARSTAGSWPPPHNRFLTYLLTPGLFPGGGWFPRGLAARFTLVSAATGPYLAVPGWDMAAHRPLPTRYAVRAGAVYFWEGDDESFRGTPDPNGTSLCDDEDDRQAGWGVCQRGDWDYV